MSESGDALDAARWRKLREFAIANAREAIDWDAIQVSVCIGGPFERTAFLAPDGKENAARWLDGLVDAMAITR